MPTRPFVLLLFTVCLATSALALPETPATKPQQPPREEWGAPPVTVTQSAGVWTIAGKKQTVALDAADLSLKIHAGPAEWNMVPSSPTDLLVRWRGQEIPLRLIDAGA